MSQWELCFGLLKVTALIINFLCTNMLDKMSLSYIKLIILLWWLALQPKLIDPEWTDSECGM